MVAIILSFFSDYLVQCMGAILICALVFRWLAYKAAKFDDIYFSTFTRELELNIDKDKEKEVDINDVDMYISDILGRVNRRLPKRSVRFKKHNYEEGPDDTEKVSLRDYVRGKQGLIASIQTESSIFNCKTPPDFPELTRRIINQDLNWTKLLGHIPIENVSRMIDILPGLFIVLGVFGTFIGISMALPEIANIDFSNLDGSGDVLSRFVVNVTFAMKTSIAGIFFSIILTILNALVPIKGTRNRIFKKLENCLQQLWYHIQIDQGDEKQMAKHLPSMVELLGKIEEHLSKSRSGNKQGG